VTATNRLLYQTLASLPIAAFATGCGGTPAPPMYPSVTGPHGITAISIPGELGYGEARLESSPVDPSARGTKPGPAVKGKRTTRSAIPTKGKPARIVVYFLGPDGKAPLAPLPEKVQALIGLPGTLPNKYIKAYDLANEPQNDDPASSARFASTPFPLPDQRITGRIKAVVQGQEVSFPLVLSTATTHDRG
jgi:hypothetical protein